MTRLDRTTRIRLALLLAICAVAAAAFAARGPAVDEQAEYSWPPAELPAASPSRTWFTPMLLARHASKALDARLLPSESEQRLREIADDGLDAVAGAPALDQGVQPLARALAHEHVDVPLALEQPLHQMAADEAGRTGHEVAAHRVLLLSIGGVSLYGRASQRTRTRAVRVTPVSYGKPGARRMRARNTNVRPREPAERNV